MTNNLSQRERIINKLLKDGEVSRNHALQNYISRLGAIICDLQTDGWQLRGEYLKTNNGKDFVYYLISSPYKKEEFKNPVTGQIITKYIK